MNSQPLVSIVTVCLNSEKTIEQTILSVLEQNYSNIEYVIVDGGSKDKTLEIIKQYVSRFNGRMKWISEKDHGIYGAMNKGLRLSSGELIGMLNSDDWYETDAISSIVDHYLNDREAVYYGIQNIYRKNFAISSRRVLPHEILLGGHMPPHQASFIPKTIYDKYGGYDIGYLIAADYDKLLSLFVNNVRFVLVDKVVVNFRLNGMTEAHQLRALTELQLARFRIVHKSRKRYLFALIGAFLDYLMIFLRQSLVKTVKIFSNKTEEQIFRCGAGIIHVGANEGQERFKYFFDGMHVIWIEPEERTFNQLKKNIQNLPYQRAIKALVSNVSNSEVDFNISSNGGLSSSMLKMSKHKEAWPEVKETEVLRMKTATLDDLLKNEQVNLSQYQILVLDVQGAELLVLQGAEKLLPSLEYVVCEVADFDAYKGGAKLTDLDDYLKKHDFVRFALKKFDGRKDVGNYFDAYYQRRLPANGRNNG
jgi:FkbM family methyltransferase